MKMYKKLLAVFLFCAVGIAQANPITIVVPVAPGGAIDLTSRTLSKILSDNGIENIVVNQPGASGDIAYNRVMKEKNNVILAGAAATFIFSSVVTKRENPYVHSMTFIAPVVKTPMAFITNRDHGFKDFETMIAAARGRGSPCGVSNAHGISELSRINKEYNTKFEPVGYKGSAPIAYDLAGNHLNCAYDSIGTHVNRHTAGQLKILADSHAVKGLNVPLISSVLPGYTFENWYGFAIPNGSNLLQNKQLMDIMNNFSSYTKHVEPMVTNGGFILEKPNKNLNKVIEQQTQLYLNLNK
jgi:tripartite-type tricarboxylate transporter receptor subunit TctC